MNSTRQRLEQIYQRMVAHFGPQHWWPAESPFEVIIGAILTQNTNWHNVEKALGNLQSAKLLSLKTLSALPEPLLAGYIRPAGYYNIKAARIHNLLALINSKYDGKLERLLAQPLPTLRADLLAVKGIGPETADSIVLYAANLPIFVVDTYTWRILSRHGLIDEKASYHEMQDVFMDNLPHEAALFNEYHALLVQVGKYFCKKKMPECASCPLHGSDPARHRRTPC